MAETVKGLNIKLGLDTTELDRQLTDLNKDLKSQGAELKAINNSLRYDSTNVELWKKKQATLNQTLEATKSKLEVQNKRLEEAKKAVQIGAMSQEEFDKLRRGVMYTEAEVNKLNNELQKTGKKITDLGNAKWDKLASVGGNLTKYVTLPIVGATTAIGAFAVSSMKTADELYDNASKVYMSVEAYQEWAHACQILAVDQSQLQKAFVKTNALLGDIASGESQNVAEALSLIGLSVEDIVGLDTDQAFMKIRNALANVGDEATRTAVANQIFGDKLGAELTQVLSATTEEIEGLRQEARDLGIVTSEQAEIAGEFTDAVDNMKMSLQSVGYEIGAIVVPILTKLCNLVINKVVPAIKGVINAWTELSKPVKGIIVALVGIVTAIGPVLVAVAKLIPMIKTLKTAFEGMNIASMVAGKWWIALIAILAVLLLQNEKFQLDSQLFLNNHLPQSQQFYYLNPIPLFS